MSIIALKGAFCVSFDHSSAQNEPNTCLLLQSRRTYSYTGLSRRMERTYCILRHKATLSTLTSKVQAKICNSVQTDVHAYALILNYSKEYSRKVKKTENRGQNFPSQYNVRIYIVRWHGEGWNSSPSSALLAWTVHTTLEYEFNLSCDTRDRTAFSRKILPVVLEKMQTSLPDLQKNNLAGSHFCGSLGLYTI